jgi:hypothetical protein
VSVVVSGVSVAVAVVSAVVVGVEEVLCSGVAGASVWGIEDKSAVEGVEVELTKGGAFSILLPFGWTA